MTSFVAILLVSVGIVSIILHLKVIIGEIICLNGNVVKIEAEIRKQCQISHDAREDLARYNSHRF